MSGFMLIAVILLSIILLSIINIVFALKCPNCNRWFALGWQELHQRSVCKHCAWFSYDTDWQPPNKGAFKTLHDLAPFKYKCDRKEVKIHALFEAPEKPKSRS